MRADASQNKEFKTLRNLILDDALIYFDVVAPLTKNVFMNIYATFDLIGSIDSLDDFITNIDILIEDAEKLQTQVELVKELHL